MRAVAAGGGADVGEQHRQEDQTVGSADQNNTQIHPDNAQFVHSPPLSILVQIKI